MDYYTADSETGSHEAVKYSNILERADVHREQTPKNTLVKETPSKKSSVSDHTESHESGFDERRDSTSSQEQLDKTESVFHQMIIQEKEKRAKNNKETKEEIETAAAEVMRELTETIVEGNHQIQKENKSSSEKIIKKHQLSDNKTESITLVSTHRLSRKELNDEINKFIGKRGNSTSALYQSSPNVSNGGERTFVEEEYSYEPELKKSSSKLVMRTRSLLNLDEENKKSKMVRPRAAKTKITTGPDGTFVIDGRKATSELNLSDESTANSNSTSPKIERYLSGEELRRRKEEIFRNINAPQPKKDPNMYHEEINKDNPQSTKEMAINNLKKYLKENKIALKELLTNKNVVIIEPFRAGKGVSDVSEYNHRNADFEKGCRITSATTKDGMEVPCEESSNNNNTLPRASKPHQPTVQRHYFYHLVKSKADPREEDLPDPDQVKSTREKFQEGKLRSPADNEIMLPIAAKIVTPYKHNQSKQKTTPEVRVIYDPRQTTSPDIKKCNNKKWTDTGSLSSGVSSDMSCFENELDNNLEEISHKGYSSDDEEEAESCTKETEIHPVSPEVMQKIRACGTTVTYYGGRVISHFQGPVRSPMTMTIMDEIRQGNEANKARSREMYMGIKFRLIKSNSCGSRLELAGTDDPSEISKNRFYQDMYGKSLGEELDESRGKMEMEDIEEVDERVHNYTRVQEEFEKKFGKDRKQPVQSWRSLIESRKQTKAREMHRLHLDMEFEEYEVAD